MAKKINGQHGVILTRIEVLEYNSKEARSLLFNKLDGIAQNVNDIKVTQAREEEKLTNTVNSFNNHKKSHWQWFVAIISIAGLAIYLIN